MHEVWHEPITDTLSLIERMMQSEIVGFNLTFDMFQLAKLYTMLSKHPYEGDSPSEIDTNVLADYEDQARFLNICIKPKAACDLMLHARKGPYQSTMDRKKIVIKKVPTVLAAELGKELENRVQVSDIHFARRKDRNAPKWRIDDSDTPEFKNLVLSFKPSSALKALAIDALKLDPNDVMYFSDIDPTIKPKELLYAPFANAVGRRGKWDGAWPDIIHIHVDYWRYYQPARDYAAKDIYLTRSLWNHFGQPRPGDDDSELACMVGVARWKGFKIDIKALKRLRENAKEKSRSAPKAPHRAKEYISQVLGPTEKAIIQGSTKKIILEEISRWLDDEDKPHPAAERANQVLDARKAQFEYKLYDKLLLAGRFHASFNIIGTLSSRMSGTDGINPQGINKRKDVRSCFLMADSNEVLGKGDFDSFEVTIAEAVYNDPDLRAELLAGKSIHGLFGTLCYPGRSYEDIMRTKGTNVDLYTRAKSAVFAMLYGGEGYTLKTRLGISEEDANRAYQQFIKKYPGVGLARRKTFDMFCSMRQPGGIGTKIEWREPEDYIESLMGFRRYFTLENQICKALYQLANKPPDHWKQFKVKVTRRDREQTTMGATQSAVYAAAFALQSANMRAAGNHVIQSSGATITKHVQRRLWDLQPVGVHGWHVRPYNVHDEVLCVSKPELQDTVERVINESVAGFKDKVPLIKMEWKKDCKSW